MLFLLEFNDISNLLQKSSYNLSLRVDALFTLSFSEWAVPSDICQDVENQEFPSSSWRNLHSHFRDFMINSPSCCETAKGRDTPFFLLDNFLFCWNKAVMATNGDKVGPSTSLLHWLTFLACSDQNLWDFHGCSPAKIKSVLL